MKRLLYTIIFYTAASTSAYASPTYILADIECERGADPELQNLNVETTPSEVVLDKEANMVILIYSKDGAAQTTLFDLGVAAEAGPRSDFRETYLARPQVLTGEMSNFYLQVSEDQSQVYLRMLDRGGELCGGGFVNLHYKSSQ